MVGTLHFSKRKPHQLEAECVDYRNNRHTPFCKSIKPSVVGGWPTIGMVGTLHFSKRKFRLRAGIMREKWVPTGNRTLIESSTSSSVNRYTIGTIRLNASYLYVGGCSVIPDL